MTGADSAERMDMSARPVRGGADEPKEVGFMDKQKLEEGRRGLYFKRGEENVRAQIQGLADEAVVRVRYAINSVQGLCDDIEQFGWSKWRFTLAAEGEEQTFSLAQWMEMSNEHQAKFFCSHIESVMVAKFIREKQGADGEPDDAATKLGRLADKRMKDHTP